MSVGRSEDEEEYTPLLSKTSRVELKPPGPTSSVAPPTTSTGGVAIDSSKVGDTTDAIMKEGDAYEKYGSRGKQTLLFVIMLITNVLGPLSTEAQVPCLQDIAIDLNTSSQWVQLSITIYMLFFGASQLLFGTLSDMYGRRRTLLFGITIYVLTNVGCALSPNVAALNIFRAVQAMGSGAGMVIVYAIARDVFKQNDRTRVLGILGGLRPIVIAASPTIGGLIASQLNWRFIFWIIGGLSACLLVLIFFFLPETRDPTTVQMTTFRDIGDTMWVLVKKKVFVGLVLVSGAVYAGVFIMFNEFSFVFENRYGYDEMDTSLLCGLVVAGLMVGALTSIALIRCMNAFQVVFVGILCILGCGAALIAPLIIYSDTFPECEGLTVYWTICPLFFYVMADGLMLPHLVSTALEPFKDIAGSASAIAGFWRFFSAAVIATIVSWASSEHLLTMHIGTAAMAVGSVVLYIFILKGADTSEYTMDSDAIEAAATESDEEAPLIGGVTVVNAGDSFIGDSNIKVYRNDSSTANNSFQRMLDKEVEIQA